MKIRTLSTLFLPLALGACSGDGGLTTIVGVTTVTFSAFAIDPDGDEVTCFWDLGDGMRPGLRASRSYPTAGTFPANVTCTDARGASSTGNSTVTARTP